MVPKVAGPSDEGQKAIQGFQLAPGLSARLWAAEPFLANPVAFATDHRGRWYVAQTFRLHAGVSDIRAHMHWLEPELASTSAESWLAILRGDKAVDLSKTNANSERIQRLADTQGLGKADESLIFAEGMDGPLSGILAGVLAHKGKVYATNIPDLWMFDEGKAEKEKGQAKSAPIGGAGQSLARGFGVRTAFLGHDLHGLRIGPDGRLYFSIGDRGANAVAIDGSSAFNPETGAVYRCNLDGTGLEIFARGLRNPQDLVFDEFGNLFTGDNNSDGGDPARIVYVLQGGDSGWRIGWQFLNHPPRGPWLSERMCFPHFEGQPAHHVPPVANLGNGPSGITYHPGTGLSPAWRNHFFLADFRGASGNSGIHSFKLNPLGAGFSISPSEKPIWNVLATDVEFGVDGGLYVLDWVNGWGMTGKGRIYKVLDESAWNDPLVQDTRRLLEEGMEHRSEKELETLLSHADMRVRQGAQFALVDRKQHLLLEKAAVSGPTQWAQLHGIWGVGQLGRTDGKALACLKPLLKHADAEVRAQSAKVLGDEKYAPAGPELLNLLKDSSPRVRAFAAIALGRLQYAAATELLLAALRENEDRDPVLRYALVSGLEGAASRGTLAEVGRRDPSRAVRIGVVNALRRSGDPAVADFLEDADPWVVAEAARAICDESIEGGMRRLASLAVHAGQLAGLPQGSKESPGPRDAVLRRVLNANYRVGGVEQAQVLARWAAEESMPGEIRREALARLGTWQKPSNVDPVSGLFRPLAEREVSTVVEMLAPFLPRLISDHSKEVALEALALVGRLGFQGRDLDLLSLVKDVQGRDPAVRVAALEAMASRKDPALEEAVSLASKDASEKVRRAAVALLVKLNLPGGAVPVLKGVLEKGSVGEQQSVIMTLAELKEKAAEEVLLGRMDLLLQGKLPPELELELWEVASKRNSPEWKERLDRYQAWDPKEALAPYRMALRGGDPSAGRKVFYEKAEASCSRCHQTKREATETVGPLLEGVGARQTREYLLESIVDPNAKIAEGFETQIVTLKDQSVRVGVLKKESEEELVLLPPGGSLDRIPKKEILSRTKGPSGMPPLGAVLSRRDLRDLVAFLASLK
jgi:quinoprotein glucose dehydrogenase